MPRQTATARKLQHKEAYKAKQHPKRRLRVVEEKGKSSSRRQTQTQGVPFPLFVLSVAALTTGLIVNVAQQALVSQISYEVETVKKEIQLAEQKQEQLLAQKAELESPERIEFVALNKLAMVKAPKITYLKVVFDDPKSCSTAATPTNSASGRVLRQAQRLANGQNRAVASGE